MPATAATQPYTIALHKIVIKTKFCAALPALYDHLLASFVTA
jgi:hypothetical protein